MDQGSEGVNLKTFKEQGVPDIAIATIVDHYAFDAGRYCTEEARLCLRAFNAIGIRSWIQELTGYNKPESSAALGIQIQRHKERVQARTTLRYESRLELVSVCVSWAQSNGKSGHTIASDVHDLINLKVFGQRSQEIKRQYGIGENQLIRDFMPKEILEKYIRLCDFIAHVVVNSGVNPVDAVNQVCSMYLGSEYPVPFVRKEDIYLAGLRLRSLKIKQEGQQLAIEFCLTA